MDEYLIKKETLDALAAQTNALFGKTDAVSPSAMISDLTEAAEDVATMSSMINKATDLIEPYILMCRMIERTIEGPLTIDESLHIEEIGASAFYGCSSLTTVDFPTVTSIGNSAFNSCSSLTTVDFPVVTSIGQFAFNSCSSLTTADFPAVTNIEDRAFYNCTSLTTLILRNTETVCAIKGSLVFRNTPIASGTGYIYVPSSLIESYKTATNWSTYAS